LAKIIRQCIVVSFLEPGGAEVLDDVTITSSQYVVM